MEEFVVLVNDEDKPLGLMEKQKAHELGVLHRAFSVFVFNKNKELLLQRRASGKYHSPNLWTNTCCSHPRAQESYEAAAHRRLKEEMGFDCNLEKKFDFIYKTEFNNGLYEHELDHVFVGKYDGEIKFNQEEVSETKWIKMDDLVNDIKLNPADYTVWFKIILEEYLNHIQ